MKNQTNIERRRPRPFWRRLPVLALAACLGAAACDNGGDGTGTQARNTIRVQSGDDQLTGFGSPLPDPLRVVVEDATTEDRVPNARVTWTVTAGAGATLATAVSYTDSRGIARNDATLGGDALYRIEASVESQVGQPATFVARATEPATIDSIVPAAASAGDTVTVYGSGFDPDGENDAVQFAGLRGIVVEASATRLRVVVPTCVPTRTASVQVLLGTVASNAVSLELTGDPGAALDLAVGQTLTLADAGALTCLRLPGSADASYLLVLQNAADASDNPLDVRVAGATDASGPIARIAAADPAPKRFDRQDHFELRVRDLERSAVTSGKRIAPMRSGSPPAPPAVGSSKQFWVYSGSGDFARVTATVQWVSDHAVLYVDNDAPAGGFTQADFQQFGDVFDDPIYSEDTRVYGAPSDIDGNARIDILFTPVVNQLTPAGAGESFVAGFFYGLDLLDDPHSNHSEVFYSLVPDPSGKFGNARSFEDVLAGVPPVLSHEFMHMIHFNQRVIVRNAGLEAPWLAEALAHTAEELVGDVYAARGDNQTAYDFKIQNYLRAGSYLLDPPSNSLLGPDTPLSVRGAGWLLLEYLREHFGGDSLYTKLTQTTTSSVANVTGKVGLPWQTILSRWGTALYADDAGIPGLDSVYTMPELNLRQVFGSGFPLEPEQLPFSDFSLSLRIDASTSAYLMLSSGASTTPLNLSIGPRSGSAFDGDARPTLTILRVE